jgi:hypothetical protein
MPDTAGNMPALPPNAFTRACLLYTANATLSSLMAAPVLFRNRKTEDVGLAKEFSHGSTQIFTASEERHRHQEGYNLCFIRVNLWPTSPSKSRYLDPALHHRR